MGKKCRCCDAPWEPEFARAPVCGACGALQPPVLTDDRGTYSVAIFMDPDGGLTAELRRPGAEPVRSKVAGRREG